MPAAREFFFHPLGPAVAADRTDTRWVRIACAPSGARPGSGPGWGVQPEHFLRFASARMGPGRGRNGGAWIQTQCPLHFSSAGATLFHPQMPRLGPQGRTGKRPTTWVRRPSLPEAPRRKAAEAPGGARERRVPARQPRQSSTTVVHRFRKAGVAGSNPAFGSIQPTPREARAPGEGSVPWWRLAAVLAGRVPRCVAAALALVPAPSRVPCVARASTLGGACSRSSLLAVRP
ncbi:MAG: hypothetical protein RL112_745 [Planctomycetota bacterium]